MKRLIFSIIAAAALAVSSIGAVAAAPPAQAACPAHLNPVIGAPGLTQAEDKKIRFGLIISAMNHIGGSNFEECFAALLEAANQ